jgi:hypothetical protein
MIYFVDGVPVEAIFVDLALSQGPAAILAAYQARNLDAIIKNLTELDIFVEDYLGPSIKYVSHSLNKIWEQRKTKPPPSDASHWKSILNIIHGEHDTCMYQPFFLFSVCSSRSLSIQAIGATLSMALIFGMKQVGYIRLSESEV